MSRRPGARPGVTLAGVPDDGEAFDVAGELLADGDTGWGNLGLWTGSADYDEACAALARAVGAAVNAGREDRLLELACGDGAALALWQREFGVRQVTAIDRRRRCIARIEARMPCESAATDAAAATPCRVAVHHGRFDRSLPLPATQRFDAVVCVDAAYHADSLTAFARTASGALETNGRLAFTTLLQGPGWQAGGWRTRGLQWALARANIPAASVLAEAEARAALTDAGLVAIRVDFLDDTVLAGFADHVARRARRLTRRQKASAGWLKIRLTAALCGYASRRRLLHYALVSARRGQH